MIKQIIVLMLITFIFAQEICPQKLIIECEKDAELGRLRSELTRLTRLKGGIRDDEAHNRAVQILND